MTGATAVDLIEAQEDIEFNLTTAINNKLDTVEQTVTIKDIGIYLHPMYCLRDQSSLWGDDRDYDRFEYEEIILPTHASQISLLAYALDEDNEYTTEDYDRWINQNNITGDEFEAYKEWVQEEDKTLHPLYHNTSDAIWNLAGDTEYRKGVLSPSPTVSILFEDEEGMCYCTLLPVPQNEETVSQLFQSVLTSQEEEIENENDTEEDDSEESSEKTEDEGSTVRTVYELTEVEATLSGHTLRMNGVEAEVPSILPVGWYSYPMVDSALDSISENSYETFTSYDDGWYNLSIPVQSSGVPYRHSITVETPFDYTEMPWSASLSDTHETRKFFENQDGPFDTINVRAKLFCSIDNPTEMSNQVIITSRTATWVLRPPETETNQESVQDESVNKEEIDSDNETGNPEMDTQTAAEEESSGLVSRVLGRDN